MKRKYEENFDEDGEIFHWVPVKSDGVSGFTMVAGRSPIDKNIISKREKSRIKRNRLKKHHKRRG